MRVAVLLVLLVGGSMYASGQGINSETSDVPQALVGKWCLINGASGNDKISDSCIMLNGDGSYEIVIAPSMMRTLSASFPGARERDEGTWSVKAGRIYYNSSQRGIGSLALQKANHPRLENTPTIVLDGLVFAAASGQAMW